MTKRFNRRLRVAAAVLLLLVQATAAAVSQPDKPDYAYKSKKFALGVGVGLVEFDTNAKVTNKDTGNSRFVDLEGNLGLPDTDNVNTIYGAFNFNEKHSLIFGYFAIRRENRLIDFSGDFNDIIILDATVDIADRSKFYNLAYGYKLFRDERSDVTLVAGLKTIDLRLGVEARGTITVGGMSETVSEVVEADVIAPIPLIGLNFGFAFDPKWSITTRIGLVGGSYQDVTARILDTNITAHYRVSDHIGILMGITHFDANIDVDEDDLLTEVSYGYRGVFIGAHFGF